MTRSGWVSAVAALALALPLLAVPDGPAAAGHRDRDDHRGWHGGGRHWHGHHNRHRHRHGHDGFSATFLWDMTPPRRAVPVPAPVYVLPPPVVLQAPPPAYCREYTATTMVNGRPVETYGTACLQPDGRWRIVSRN